ncbi:DUF2306 domain-containing protein (plasmid) [Streptomyces sp. BI20]|uniref:DUF2306 domain-containing protein n=1 Tax=Streptomyces sp. BI20 TaxID=3403460 RepID=UPI003C75D597
MRVGRVAALAVTALCLAYAPVAATELWPYARPGAPALGEWILAHTVSAEYVAEALAGRVGPYGRSLIPLIVHSVLGGLLMLLGPLQLLTARRGRIRAHRILGALFAGTVLVSMAGAAVYLARTAPADAFSGPAFWIVLATILVGTVGAVVLGVAAALARMPDLHQRWMLLCWGFLMTAPLLRLEWGGLPRLFPGDLSMAEINTLAIAHLGLLVTFGALLGSRALDRRAFVPGVRGTWTPWPVLLAAHLLGAGAVAVLLAQVWAQGQAGQRLAGAWLVPYLLCHGALAFAARRAGRRGRVWPREEWRTHLVASALSPALSLAVLVPFERALHLDRATALVAALAVGAGLVSFGAVSVVGLRLLYARELVRRGQADGDGDGDGVGEGRAVGDGAVAGAGAGGGAGGVPGVGAGAATGAGFGVGSSGAGGAVGV